MAIKTSGTLSFVNDIVAEFADSPSHSLSEFYGRDTNIPGSGTISFSDFYGASDLMSNADLWNLLRNSDHTKVRNTLFSASNFGSGMETSTETSFRCDDISRLYRYTPNITATYRWPDIWPLVIGGGPPFAKTSYLTIVIRNLVADRNEVSVSNGTVGSIEFDGVTYNANETYNYLGNQSGANWDHFLTVFRIETGTNPLSGKRITVEYTKDSSGNPSLQEMFVFPGKWNTVRSVNGRDNIECGTVVANDLLIGGKWRDGGDSSTLNRGVFQQSITPYYMLKRDASFDGDTCGSRVAFANASESLTYDAGTSSDRGHALILRLEHA